MKESQNTDQTLALKQMRFSTGYAADKESTAVLDPQSSLQDRSLFIEYLKGVILLTAVALVLSGLVLLI